jgi:hypothetical protein
MEWWKKTWAFLKEDSWQSTVVTLIILVVVIKFIFFPLLSFVTSSELPLVVIESCSLYHDESFDEWWNENAEWYELRGITKNEFKEFPYTNGLNKGDIIFVWGRGDYELGDIIIFTPNAESRAPHPIIHRVISEDPLGTKGDNNAKQLTQNNNNKFIDETDISEEQVLGKSVFRVPALGWIKLVFFEFTRPSGERGFCS